MKKSTHGKAPWDPDRYLNVWICDMNMDPLGYATFPADTIKATMGVVIDYKCFGVDGSHNHSAYNKGRTATHEVGHFFGLRHIWGDGRGCAASGAAANCACSNDDGISDTPNHGKANYGCPNPGPVTCSNGGDMYKNYMDYVNDTWMCMFTTGQRARMLSHLAPGGARAQLAISNGLYPANATNIDWRVFLEAQNDQLPAWQAAMVMVYGWARQMTPNLPMLLEASASQCASNRVRGLPNEISDNICALSLTPEEILSCFPVESFYKRVLRGPVALLSVNSSEYYGLVVSGMVMNSSTGQAVLKIKDPQGVGPQFGIDQRGSEYNVEYGQFMTEILERLAARGTHVYFVYPPARDN